MNFEKRGFLIPETAPHFGASPDGVDGDTVLEIKCPSKDSSVAYYTINGLIPDKVRAQLLLQIWIFHRPKGILAIADPNFEHNKKITFLRITFDKEYVTQLCMAAENWWARNIYPTLIS